MKERLFHALAMTDRLITRLFNPLMNGYYRLKHRVTGSQLARLEDQLKTPDQIAAWVTNHIIYRMDPVHGLLNNIQQPAVTVARGAGDCDDSSYLCLHLLRRQGYRTWLLTLFTLPMEQSHSVCVFAEGDLFHHISNWGLRRVGAPSLAAVAGTVLSTWHSGHLQTPDLQTVAVFTPANVEVAAARLEPLQ